MPRICNWALEYDLRKHIDLNFWHQAIMPYYTAIKCQLSNLELMSYSDSWSHFTISLSHFTISRHRSKTRNNYSDVRRLLFLGCNPQSKGLKDIKKSFDNVHSKAIIYWISQAPLWNSTTVIRLIHKMVFVHRENKKTIKKGTGLFLFKTSYKAERIDVLLIISRVRRKVLQTGSAR